MKPNILVIMSDQHSPHALGCADYALVRTPNLDRLAAGGMRFNNAYCAAPLCVPSRMSFMTSRTPSHNSVWDNQHVLPSGIPTWAHSMGAAGYETALIGRMHFVGSDQRHGFEKRPIGEYWSRYPGAPNPPGPSWRKFPGSTSGQSRVSVEIAGKGTTTYQWLDEQVAAATQDYLREWKNQPNQRPFAAVAGFVLPHCPFVAPKNLFEYYYEKIDIPAVEAEQPAAVTRYRDHRGILEPLPPERIRVARAAYFALCEYFDSLVGKVLDCLETEGLAENTLVVYCSDHGEQAGEHGCWWKSTYYEASARVPLIARLPGEIPAGSVNSHLVNLMDLGPTFIELGGGKSLPVCDGHSLWPILEQLDSKNWQEETFSELVDIRHRGHFLASRMIRAGKWKLWKHDDADNLPPVLFDLEADPDELNDLGEHPDYAEIRDELLGKLYQQWNPKRAAEMTQIQNSDYKTLCDWGQVVAPEHPDTLPAPSPEIENDVELL